jgi:hypothetical protein
LQFSLSSGGLAARLNGADLRIFRAKKSFFVGIFFAKMAEQTIKKAPAGALSRAVV